MNIFVTDLCPKQSAQNVCDKHMKMIVESCQLLATCFDLNILAKQDCPKTQKGTNRKWFNPNHPSSKWCRESRENLNWILQHTRSLLDEKYYRYPDSDRHFCHDFVDWVSSNLDLSFVPIGPQTDFKIAINENMSCRLHPLFENGSVVDKYRLYYTHDKPFAKWTGRPAPSWFFDKKYSKSLSAADT